MCGSLRFTSPVDPDKPQIVIGSTFDQECRDTMTWVGFAQQESTEEWEADGWEADKLWGVSHFTECVVPDDPFKDMKTVYYPTAGRYISVLKKEGQLRIVTRPAIKGEEHINSRWPVLNYI